MNNATAQATVTISIMKTQSAAAISATTNELIERYRRWFTLSAPLPSDVKLESVFRASVLQPSWLAEVQRALVNSVTQRTIDTPGDGRWISQEVANAGADFFAATADILPDRPFIYSSRQGDLVAELSAKRGTLTAVISSGFVLLFAVAGGVSVERRVTKASALREEVRRLVEPLLSEVHGDLATEA